MNNSRYNNNNNNEFQKYWPKPNADPLNVSSIESVKKKFSRYEKRPEDIKHLVGTMRMRNDLQIFECPPIKNCGDSHSTAKSLKSTNTAKLGNGKPN